MVKKDVLVGYDVVSTVVPIYEDVTVQDGYEDITHTISEGTLRFFFEAWQDGKLKEALIGRFGPDVLRRVVVVGGALMTVASLLMMCVAPPIPTPTPTVTATATVTPTVTATLTMTPTLTVTDYPLIPEGLVPPITGDWGPCVPDSSVPEHRAACAALAYQEALNQLGGSMTWEELMAITLASEGGVLYSGEEANWQCQYGDVTGAEACHEMVGLFERAAMRNLSEACLSDGVGSCSEAEMVSYLGGIQPWYAATTYEGTADSSAVADLVETGSAQSYRDIATDLLNQDDLLQGCQGYSCSWGNASCDPIDGDIEYYISRPADEEDVYSVEGRVYFVVGAIPEWCQFR